MTPTPQRSQLVPGGVLLIALGVLAPQQLQRAAAALEPGAMRGILFILTDVFRAGFFLGAALLIIGLLRNRKARLKP